jgi:MarR family transcriptional regulator, temperature-dependent positive regulator of motility
MALLSKRRLNAARTKNGGLTSNARSPPSNQKTIFPQSRERVMNADGLNRSPVHLLHRAAQSVGNVFDSVIGDKGGLTPRQLMVLAAVGEDEGLNQTAIVLRTNIDRSTTADIVKRLKRKGWLQRQRTKEDARAYAVKLTEEGRRVLRSAEPLSRRVDTRVLGALSASQRERFIEALSLIVETLEKTSPGNGRA